MTENQKQLIKHSFSKVAPIADTAASLFYARLFQLDPQLKRLFHNDAVEQRRKLMDMIALAVDHVDDLSAIVSATRELGRRHIHYGVRAQDYDTVARALLDALEQGLGADFTPATRAAWTELYSTIAETMQSGQRARA